MKLQRDELSGNLKPLAINRHSNQSRWLGIGHISPSMHCRTLDDGILNNSAFFNNAEESQHYIRRGAAYSARQLLLVSTIQLYLHFALDNDRKVDTRRPMHGCLFSRCKIHTDYIDAPIDRNRIISMGSYIFLSILV
jgi:hypothetical protein